jgi:hypothetical protein
LETGHTTQFLQGTLLSQRILRLVLADQRNCGTCEGSEVTDRRHSAHEISPRRRRSADSAFEGILDSTRELGLPVDVAEVACADEACLGIERPSHMTGWYPLLHNDVSSGQARLHVRAQRSRPSGIALWRRSGSKWTSKGRLRLEA